MIQNICFYFQILHMLTFCLPVQKNYTALQTNQLKENTRILLPMPTLFTSKLYTCISVCIVYESLCPMSHWSAAIFCHFSLNDRFNHVKCTPALPFTHRLKTSVNLIIFACLNFREFLILGLLTKFRIREFPFFFCSAIIIIIFARFLISRISPLLKFAKN